jgi:hypothetical protein
MRAFSDVSPSFRGEHRSGEPPHPSACIGFITDDSARVDRLLEDPAWGYGVSWLFAGGGAPAVDC